MIMPHMFFASSCGVSHGIDTVPGAFTRAVRRAAALGLLMGVTGWSNASAQGPVLESQMTPATVVAPEQQAEATFCCQKRHFWVAAGEFLALEIVPNYFNRFVADDTTAVQRRMARSLFMVARGPPP